MSSKHRSIFDLTKTQKEAFKQYLTGRRRSYINLQEPLSFARLLIGDKPGMIMSPLEMPSAVEYEPTITISELVGNFLLAYTKTGSDLVLARTESQLELFTVADHSHEQIGEFLGYPKADIDHYRSSDPPYTEPKDLTLDGAFSPEELAYITYVPQRNEDTIEGYKRAIEEGKKVRSTVEECATRWDLEELSDYSEWIYYRTVAEYYGHRL